MTVIVALLALLISRPALAHEGHVHWLTLRTTWTLDPWISLPLGSLAILYVAGVHRIWRRAGWGRGVRLWQVGSFVLAWMLLVLALMSPVHWLGDRLFVAHMIEHEILMTLAAPLLVIARPGNCILWALPIVLRRRLGALGRIPALTTLWRRWLTNPLIATILHGGALWIWHAPVLYEAALQDTGIHWLQHLSFFVTALLFWSALLYGRVPERSYGAAVFYLFATSLHSGFLGILITLAHQPLYPLQTSAAPEWSLSPLEDQQLAGLVMWVPAGLVYALAALTLSALWIKRSGAHAAQAGPYAIPAR